MFRIPASRVLHVIAGNTHTTAVDSGPVKVITVTVASRCTVMAFTEVMAVSLQVEDITAVAARQVISPSIIIEEYRA